MARLMNGSTLGQAVVHILYKINKQWIPCPIESFRLRNTATLLLSLCFQVPYRGCWLCNLFRTEINERLTYKQT